ncbi:MAG: hypothetical protein KIT14_19515 [bacterium]|nr:hypothetical protein [bacterium]
MRSHPTEPLLTTLCAGAAAGPLLLAATERPTRGEDRLLAAVLEDAVRCWRSYAHAHGRRAVRLRGELRDWFRSDALDSPFDFAAVCDHFHLDPAAVRTRLGLDAATPVAA